MKIRRLAFPLLCSILAAWLWAAGSALAASPDNDIRPAKTGVTVTGIVEEDYSDGLLVSTSDGVTYLILTPESVSLEQEESFHNKFKGKQVSLTGNLYRDEDGSLSLLVATLPGQ